MKKQMKVPRGTERRARRENISRNWKARMLKGEEGVVGMRPPKK